ncbi:MAG: glycerol kinase GlpK [Desulfuromonadales bacterium]|nr:glycerol kinase GlpK [Desulfuromonadales bacterium]
MGDFILAIDQGTTSTTALLIDHRLTVRGRASVDFPQHFPRPGWVEHDPEEIWFSVLQAVRRALEAADVTGAQVAAIGLTNQRETTLLWERASGRPVGNAIVWQDRRSADICQQLRERGAEPLLRQKTGLLFDPYFSGTKLTWRLRHDPQLAQRAHRGELAFGTVDTFLVWRLTGGVHVTDVSNASRTLLMDLHTLQWDDELLQQLEVAPALLPEIRPSSEVYGYTRGLEVLPDGIAVAGMAGDQQAALFGQTCFAAGESKCTYGTGAFLLENTGGEIIESRHRLLTTVGWQVGGETVYALEGSAFIAGAAVQWLRDGLNLFPSSAAIEALAASVPDSGEVIFVPALTGLGAPHWRSEARGVISGLTRGTTAAHLARATLEGIALQIVDLARAMAEDRGEPLTLLKVDGGAAQNNLLMQLQADLLGLPVVRPQLLETTALGAALLAGLSVGFWSGQQEVKTAWRQDRVFEPQMSADQRQTMCERWQRAVERA